jgi:DNA-binding transcriptional regulator YhcF (GntR family)
MSDDTRDTHIPLTLNHPPTISLAAVAAAICRLGLKAGDALPMLDVLARASGVHLRTVQRCLDTLRATNALRRAGSKTRGVTIVEDEATLAYASTPLGATELEARVSGGDDSDVAEGSAATSGKGAPTLATFAAQMEALIAEVSTLRAAVQEGVSRAGHAEALAARLAGEVAELRARLDSGGVAPLPLAPRSLPAPTAEPREGDLDDLKALVFKEGGQSAAARVLGVTRDQVKHALTRERVSPVLAAALHAHLGA